MTKRYKGFSFTYSKLKSFETCPLQHQQATILKQPGMEASGDAIDYGNRVHTALAEAIKNDIPLVPAMRHLQYWVDWFKGIPGEQFVEEKWGMTRDFGEADFFSNFAWLRLIVDAAKVHGPIGRLVDWKTGKRLEEPLQLWLGAACMFAKFPWLKVVDSMFVWLKEDDGRNSHECISAQTVRKEEIGDIWTSLLPRIEHYEHTIAADGPWPARPGDHCKFCRYQGCEFFGKGR